MSASEEVAELIRRRANRAIKAILTEKERVADDYLDHEDAEELRRTVLNEINDVASLASALVGSIADESREINELYLSMISDIHDRVCG